MVAIKIVEVRIIFLGKQRMAGRGSCQLEKLSLTPLAAYGYRTTIVTSLCQGEFAMVVNIKEN